MSKLVWTGARESDIKFTGDFFQSSVTLYGEGKGKNKSFCSMKDYRINHNRITKEQTEFMIASELKMIEEDESIQFMAYNPNLVYGYNEKIRQHTICLNDEDLMRFLDSKIDFRKFASDFVPVLNSKLMLGSDCTIEMFKKCFPKSNAWIVQADIASGGYGTHWVTKNNAIQVLEELDKAVIYLVSPYYKENIPINIHAIIYQDEILLTPGSIQIEKMDRNRLLYRGADYIAYKDINVKIREQFIKNVKTLCREIQKKGYRGVIGIDALVVDGIARILEVNNRFQASTLLINKVLKERHLPSLHELNYEAFRFTSPCKISNAQIQALEINYSIYAFINEEITVHPQNILKNYKIEKTVADFVDDGYVVNQECEDDSYLFKLIFTTNITDIVADKEVRIHQNIVAPTAEWYMDIVDNKDFKKIKISLLNQGVVLEDTVKEYLEQNGGMRPGVYFAVDLILNEKYIVNAPLAVKFSSLSPFRVTMKEDELFLLYYSHTICKVRIDFADKLAEKVIGKSIPVSRIGLLATDRLRIQHSDYCIFKEKHMPCKFCEAEYRNIKFDLKDIQKAIDLYFESDVVNFRHILIGGLSNEMGKEKEVICELIKYIRNYSNMPIYLMCLPSICENDIEEYVKLGVTEIGFNLEIYDRRLAVKYMPGKGNIPLERYKKAMEKAVSLLGNKGAVRSAFVVGLESMESLLQGVEFICKIGVAPIFSVFRPIPYTEMENVNPPENEWLLEAYQKAEAICSRYKLKMGPDCVACQNNTLSFDSVMKL